MAQGHTGKWRPGLEPVPKLLTILGTDCQSYLLSESLFHSSAQDPGLFTSPPLAFKGL